MTPFFDDSADVEHGVRRYHLRRLGYAAALVMTALSVWAVSMTMSSRPDVLRRRDLGPSVVGSTATEEETVYQYPDLLYESPELCQSLTLLTPLVLSRPNKRSERDLFRNLLQLTTHGEVQPIFFFGLSAHDKDGADVNAAALNEALEKRDVVIGKFADTYEHLPVKTTLGFKWYSECKNPRSEYLLKVDIDIMVNWRSLLAGIKSIQEHGAYHMRDKTYTPVTEPIWMGARWDGMGVIHDKKHRNYEDYESNIFPPYTSGSSYLYNRKMTEAVVKRRSAESRSFRNEDAMVGVLMNGTGIEPIHSTAFLAIGNPSWRSHVCQEVEVASIDDPHCDCTKWWTYNCGFDDGECIRAVQVVERCLAPAIEQAENSRG